MDPRPIHHIGVLVTDIEDAITRWSAATGYEFGPVVRYRTERWRDHDNPTEHLSDVKISFSIQGSPHIELMEVFGTGTHGVSEAGWHHLGFLGVPDVDSVRSELGRLGIEIDGSNTDDDGTTLCFTDKYRLDGVRLEYVSDRPQPVCGMNNERVIVDGARFVVIEDSD